MLCSHNEYTLVNQLVDMSVATGDVMVTRTAQAYYTECNNVYGP
jgi:hypothetical protein